MIRAALLAALIAMPCGLIAAKAIASAAATAHQAEALALH